MTLKIKICGMRETANITQLLALCPDFMGFIFSDKSSRFVADSLDEDLLLSFPKETRKIGVFVNAQLDTILKQVKKYSLDMVQLHGDETPAFCQSLRNRGISLIKAFAVDNSFSFSRLNNYKTSCDYFLFDTKGNHAGGNGVKFDWKLLENYDQGKPFFLSGGIGSEDIETLLNLPANLNLFAIDINSRFEIEPALKDIDKIRHFMTNFKPVLQEN